MLLFCKILQENSREINMNINDLIGSYGREF